MDLRKIERVYTGYARVYNRIFGTIFQRSREAAIRDLNVQPEERVLEVGVGTGLCLPLYPVNCRITGIVTEAECNCYTSPRASCR